MGTGARSVNLIKASWFVLRSNKALAVFPVLSAVTHLVVAGAFIGPAVAISWDDSASVSSVKPAPWVLVAAFYFVAAYTTIFFNAALISQANEALSGGRASVKAGLSVAGRNWLRIAPWALLSASVSIILRVLEERLGILGRIVAAIIGLAWNLVTFMVLPILVLERVGVSTAIRRSSEMLKRTWGENIVGNVGIGLFVFVAMIPSLVLFVLGVSAGHATLLVCFALAIAWMAVVSVVASAMSGIYQTALYRYAATEGAAEMFGDFPLSQAFRERRRR